MNVAPPLRFGPLPCGALVMGVALLLALAGCSSGASLASGLATSEVGAAGGDQVLKFHNWDTYMDPAILTEFERRFGVQVDYQIYDNDNDMVRALRAGETGYDLVVPSDFNVAILRQEGLLAPLNPVAIPHLKNMDPTFANPIYDPGNRYCVPYQWGTVGIGYNLEATGREIRSWADFFRPEFAGRVAMLDDYRVTLGIALIMLGYSPNSTETEPIAAARDFLVSRADHIAAYTGDEAQDRLADGTYAMVMEWSGDVLQLAAQDPSVRYVIPAEGSIIWTDSLCIPATAEHQTLAEQFINYLLEPAVGAALSNYTRFGSPNVAALRYIDPADLNNPALYPPADIRQRLFFVGDVNLAATIEYERAWAAVLASKGR